MNRVPMPVLLLGAMLLGAALQPGIRAQGLEFAGRWALNRELSRIPREVGFDLEGFGAGGADSGSAAGGRERRAPTATPFGTRPQSADDARRLQLLTDEVRNPSPMVTIVETPAGVTMTNASGQSRSFTADGKERIVRVDTVPVAATARRDGARLVVLYKVEQGRELRYLYQRTASPPQLIVDVEFIERVVGDRVRLVYEPGSAPQLAQAADSTGADHIPTAGTPAPAAAPQRPSAPPAAPAPPVPAVRPAQPASPAQSAAPAQPAPVLAPAPDAELKGITRLGVVVEELSAQAASCGLSRPALEAAVSKRFTDAGFRVSRLSSEDTYAYLNVITTSVSAGLCVSRYDASLNTHTMAKLPYQDAPLLVEVQLLHKGGIAGGAPATHGDAVLRGLQEYIDQFISRIRAVNK